MVSYAHHSLNISISLYINLSNEIKREITVTVRLATQRLSKYKVNLSHIDKRQQNFVKT